MLSLVGQLVVIQQALTRSILYAGGAYTKPPVRNFSKIVIQYTHYIDKLSSLK